MDSQMHVQIGVGQAEILEMMGTLEWLKTLEIQWLYIPRIVLDGCYTGWIARPTKEKKHQPKKQHPLARPFINDETEEKEEDSEIHV